MPPILSQIRRLLGRSPADSIKSLPEAALDGVASHHHDEIIVEGNYAWRMANEKAFYKEYLNVTDLPPIFVYWSVKHLTPMFQSMGYESPIDLMSKEFARYARRHPDTPIRAVSIGAGNCDIEVEVIKPLVEAGITNIKVELLDINKTMLERGLAHARDAGLSDYFAPLIGDFNQWQPEGEYDIVIANQSLHHVMNLEGLFSAIHDCLKPEGRFIVSDMVGRNGHLRWPEARAALDPFWKRLPESYRFNNLLNRYEEEFMDFDCSMAGFEGIRAQDIMPLLTERFHFEVFLPFANIVYVFIERAFGHNFDADGVWDRAFVDEVHARDMQGILSGELKPTQMVASLSKQPVALTSYEGLTPEFCTRIP